jgi:hypothetical protein
MYQHFLIVNLDRKEYLDPTAFGDGPTPAAAARTRGGVLAGLAALLSEGRGGFRSAGPVVGSWAGDRVIAAWYDGDPVSGSGRNLYRLAADCYRDISRPVLRALADDPPVAVLLRNRRTDRGLGRPSVYEYATMEEFESDD